MLKIFFSSTNCQNTLPLAFDFIKLINTDIFWEKFLCLQFVFTTLCGNKEKKNLPDASIS